MFYLFCCHNKKIMSKILNTNFKAWLNHSEPGRNYDQTGTKALWKPVFTANNLGVPIQVSIVL